MAELAPELLRWLSTVLAPKYHSANRTYTDAATLLHHYRSLSPKTDVYTYDDGRSDLLLCIHGTLPVAFRGATYNIPLNIWVPHQYPNTPPTVMVVPGKNMGIRPTNHVDTNGRCYHPYLAYWSQNPDKSTLIDLCGQLKDVFGKEPPLYSKQPPPQQQPVAVQQSAATPPPPPPPRPPLPHEIEAQKARFHPAAATEQAAPPPPPPPKAEPQHPSPAAYSYTTTPHLFTPQNQSTPQPVASPPLRSPPPPQNNNQAPPERPALPQKLPHEEPRPAYPIQSPAYQQTQSPPPPPPVPPIPSPIRNSITGGGAASPGPRSPPPPHSPYHYQQQQQHPASPPPPPLPVHPQHGWHPQSQPPPSHAHRLSGQYDPLNRFPTPTQQVTQQQQRPISIHGYPPHQLPAPIGPSNLNPQSTTLPQRSQSQRKPFNILDADDTTSLLPSPSKPAIPPPLPPNPEKDKLITEISKILHQKSEAAVHKTAASLEQTASQAEAMAKTEAYMERERIELIRINDVCEKDQRILNERIAMADELIREVRDREAPNIDAVVVAPTVVHNQLYELVTDDMAIEDTIYVLGKALDKERITLDVFLKHTRALAREQFMKRALVKKISRQIGMT
ncbi:hypothetical protein TWF481_005734 [Arthrobotrys musiformis]|uniref:UEV-domain-containing protein n=1 Tax=Arthrobotrys musiformis TaxID=47236 RepID=A0AAV9WEK4_9PEZI